MRDALAVAGLQNTGDDIGTMLLAGFIQMRINVGCGADGAVPQEVGHIDQGFFFCQQQTCECVPQIMEADLSQAVLFQQITKVVGHIIWPE